MDQDLVFCPTTSNGPSSYHSRILHVFVSEETALLTYIFLMLSTTDTHFQSFQLILLSPWRCCPPNPLLDKTGLAFSARTWPVVPLSEYWPPNRHHQQRGGHTITTAPSKTTVGRLHCIRPLSVHRFDWFHYRGGELGGFLLFFCSKKETVLLCFVDTKKHN